jgi:uncharacterized protein YndB with AHSA1/START domain
VLGKFSCVADPKTSNLVMTQTFDASPADVFEAWTNPDEVTLWWDPTGAPLAVCEIDLSPNGTFRWVHQGELGLKHPFTGVYREIVPPERLVFEARISPEHPLQRSTLSFSAVEGGTTLTMTIECASAAYRDQMLAMRVDAGTARTMQNLAAHLNRRQT